MEAALDNVPNINYDSYVFMASARKWLSSLTIGRHSVIHRMIMFALMKLTVLSCMFSDGTVKMWDIIVGFNTDSIAKLRGAGFNIALTLKIIHTKTLYLDETNKIIKDYIRYLKAIGPTDEKENKYSKRIIEPCRIY